MSIMYCYLSTPHLIFEFQFLQVLFEFQFEETLDKVETSCFSCVEPNTCIKYGAVTFESHCQKSNRIGRSFEAAMTQS